MKNLFFLVISITVIFSLNGNLLFAKPNASPYTQFSDSLLNVKFNNIEQKLSKIEKNHSDFEYQKNYFTQALDSQNTIYSMNTTLFATLVTILFGLIGFIVYWRITANFKNEVASLNDNYEKIVLSLNKDKADIYTAHMNIMDDFIDKIEYGFLSSKFYILAGEFKEALDSLEFFNNKIFNNLKKTEKYSTFDDFAENYNLLKELININKSTQHEYSTYISPILESIKNRFQTLNPNYNDEQ